MTPKQFLYRVGVSSGIMHGIMPEQGNFLCGRSRNLKRQVSHAVENVTTHCAVACAVHHLLTSYIVTIYDLKKGYPLLLQSILHKCS